ncbi:hypothetical protein Taro_046765, partial [Colocasia esculenta]|nr:hypothetical protein [Colocasia esculenta]
AMASRGRCNTQAREDEQRREERDEQQAPAPQGPTVLPPPPPVDYGVFMQGPVQAQAPTPVPQEHGHGGASIMERFKRMAPPSFKGESQPLLAESWMREVENIIWAIRCAEEDNKRADVWWASMLRTRYEDGAIEATWAEFTRLFKAKFIPEHIQDKMEQEFLCLTQKSIAVLEYEARFSELSKYAPHIVADKCRKAKKFVMGLKPSLRSRLVAFDHRTLDEALSAACSLEEFNITFPESIQEEGSGVPVATASSSSELAHSCTTDTQLQAQRQEDVSSLRKGTWQHRVLEACREVPEVWQHRAPDLRLPQTSAVCSERSVSPNNGSSSSTSDWETRKASGPSLS